MGYLRQFTSTGILCILCINAGLVMWWPMSTITIITSESRTPLNRAMTETELTLLLSLVSFGALISTLTGGFLLHKLGRKKCSILISWCFILFWIVLILCRQVKIVLTIVFFSGICSSASLVTTIYISEICQKSIRGSMTASYSVASSTGMLLIYGLSGTLSYDALLYVGLSMSIFGALLLFLLKDSPVYLMQIGQETEAIKAIAYFRQLKTSDNKVINEILRLKRSMNPKLDDGSHETENLNPNLKTHMKLPFWKFMMKSKSSQRAIVINVVLFTTSIFQGLPVVQTFAVPLFSEAIPSLSSEGCSVFLGIVIVAAQVVGAYLTDFTGRRNLMIYGSLGTGITCVVLGTQMHLHWGPNWVHAIFLYLYSVMNILGAGTVPMVLQAEIFLPEVRSILSTVVIEWSWLCYALIFFITNPILFALGWATLFYIFAVMSFITVIISVFYLPETKGLTVEEIQPLFLTIAMTGGKKLRCLPSGVCETRLMQSFNNV